MKGSKGKERWMESMKGKARKIEARQGPKKLM